MPSTMIAVNSQTVPGADAEAFLVLAARAGFSAVELAGELVIGYPDRLRNVIDGLGLQLLGLCPTPALHDWHWRWDERIEQQLIFELDVAASLGAGYFVMPFMRDAGDVGSVSAGLARAVPLAAERGIRLAVEPIGHHAVLRLAKDLAPVLEVQDPGVVGLLLDSFHFFRAGQSVADLAQYDRVPILALQVANANDRPREQLLGYRDRTFPLDGPFPVQELVDRIRAERPHVPIVVEVIGEVAASHDPDEGIRLAHEQAERFRAPNEQRGLLRD